MSVQGLHTYVKRVRLMHIPSEVVPYTLDWGAPEVELIVTVHTLNLLLFWWKKGGYGEEDPGQKQARYCKCACRSWVKMTWDADWCNRCDRQVSEERWQHMVHGKIPFMRWPSCPTALNWLTLHELSIDLAVFGKGKRSQLTHVELKKNPGISWRGSPKGEILEHSIYGLYMRQHPYLGWLWIHYT